jgi:hypothetical protein
MCFVVCTTGDVRAWKSMAQLVLDLRYGHRVARFPLLEAVASLGLEHDEKEIFAVCGVTNIRGTLMKGWCSQARARRKSQDSSVVELVPEQSHDTHWVVRPAIIDLIVVVRDEKTKRLNLFAQIRRFTCQGREARIFKRRIQKRFATCPEIANRFCVVSTSFGFHPHRGGQVAVVPLQRLVGKLVLVPPSPHAENENMAEGAYKIAHALMRWGLPPPGGSGGLTVQAIHV